MGALVVLLFMGGAFGLPCLLLHRSLRFTSGPLPRWAFVALWLVLMLALIRIPADSAPITAVFRTQSAGR